MTVLHEGDGDESGFTCCAFGARERLLMLGTCFGRLNLFDVSSGEKVADYNCHTSAITHLEPSRVGPVVPSPPRLPRQDPGQGLSSSDSGPNGGSLMVLPGRDAAAHLCVLEFPSVCALERGRSLEQEVKCLCPRGLVPVILLFSAFLSLPRLSFVDEHYVEFSKLAQDRVIGTKDEVAHVGSSRVLLRLGAVPALMSSAFTLRTSDLSPHGCCCRSTTSRRVRRR